MSLDVAMAVVGAFEVRVHGGREGEQRYEDDDYPLEHDTGRTDDVRFTIARTKDDEELIRTRRIE